MMELDGIPMSLLVDDPDEYWRLWDEQLRAAGIETRPMPAGWTLDSDDENDEESPPKGAESEGERPGVEGE